MYETESIMEISTGIYITEALILLEMLQAITIFLIAIFIDFVGREHNF